MMKLFWNFYFTHYMPSALFMLGLCSMFAYQTHSPIWHTKFIAVGILSFVNFGIAMPLATYLDTKKRIKNLTKED